MKRPGLQNKRVGVLLMAFGARNVFGTFEKRAPKAWPKRPAAKEYVSLFKPKTRKNMSK